MPQLTIDWIGLTYPDDLPLEDTEAVFVGEWSALDHGGNGYRSAAQNSHVTIFHDGNPGMGHHLRLTSHGLRQVEAQEDFAGWPGWLREELERGANPTRIDLALDDNEALVDFPTIVEHLRSRTLTTRYKGWGHTQTHKFESEDDTPEGEIVRLGSRASTTFIRIYDRAARISVPGHLIRFEIEWKKGAALRVACAIATAQDDTSLGALAVGILRGLVEFQDPEGDSNSAAPLAPWWATFCGEAEKVRLSLGKPVRTIEKVRGWLEKQVSPSLRLLAIVAELEDKSPHELMDALVSAGEGRLSTAHLQMLHDHTRTMRPRMTVRGRGEPEADPGTDDQQAGGGDRGEDDDDH